VPRSDSPTPTVSQQSELRAPTLLIAMPQVLDPFFHKSVVLLIHQDDEGSFGVIVNRRTDARLSEILDGLEIEWRGDEDARAFFGGPVQPQLGTVLFPIGEAGRGSGPRAAPEDAEPAAQGGRTMDRLDAAAECAPGVALTHHVADLGKLAAEPLGDLRLFLGYAGWGAGQLVEEILRDDWLLAPVRRDLVFSADPDGVWEEALRSVGVDPASLPSWSVRAEDEEGQTN
jgi:putative transcriptional regulator